MTFNTSQDLSTISNNDCNVFVDSNAVKIIKTLAYSALLIVSLMGNSVVVAAIFRRRELQTIINFFILNMCISDLLIPIFVFPDRIKQIYFQREVWLIDGVFGSFTCKSTLFLENTSVIVSVLGLLVISVERFYCVVYPMKCQPIHTKRACFALIGASWFIAIGFCSHFLYTRRIELENNATKCVYSWKPVADTRKTGNLLHLTFLICFTIIPFLVLTMIYISIALTINLKRTQFKLASRNQRNYRVRQSRQISLMVAAVVAVFLLSWTPANVYIFLRTFAEWKVNHPCRYRHLIFTSNYLSYSYIAFNPLIYYSFSTKFRRGIREIICCNSCVKTRPSNSTWTVSVAMVSKRLSRGR